MERVAVAREMKSIVDQLRALNADPQLVGIAASNYFRLKH